MGPGSAGDREVLHEEGGKAFALGQPGDAVVGHDRTAVLEGSQFGQPAWHSDGEKELVKNGAIASVSLGADRLFSFKHKKEKEVKSFLLEHGSLLIMKGETQTHWLHRLPPTKKVHLPRINLTFRKIAQ